MKKVLLLFLSVVFLLSLVAGCTPAADLPPREYALKQGWHEAMFQFLAPTSNAQIDAITPGLEARDMTVEHDGVSIALVQTVTDASCMHAVFEIQVSPDVEIPADLEARFLLNGAFKKGNCCQDEVIYFGPQETLDNGTRRWSVAVTCIAGEPGELEAGYVKCFFEDLGWWSENEFTPVLQGKWTFSIPVMSAELESTVHYDEPFELDGAQVEQVTLCVFPTSITVEAIMGLRDDGFGNPDITVTFRDGTKTVFRYVDRNRYGFAATPWDWGAGQEYGYPVTRQYIHHRFPSAIVPTEVESVAIADVEIPFNP